ncbi:MAG: hypothetical protein P8P74_01325 [Crocinitomicaceae bacterium]|nr:hypothetical protein [Crocinitomicaceae bacterium]
MTNEKINWKQLAILKFVIGGLLVIVGVMGGLEALKNLWSFRGIPSIGILPIVFQLLWAFGNSALLLVGLLYLQQGKILLKPLHEANDSKQYNKNKRRATVLVIIILVMSLAILLMNYLSAKELVQFLGRYR